MMRGRPRSWSGAGATWRGTIRPSSRSAAVIAETVVGLSSVCSEISTREIGPERRMASITWKRLIARISSGSAVFMAAPSAGMGSLINPDTAFILALSGGCQ